MSYTVRKRNIGFCVVEKDTNITLAKFENQEEARQLVRSLNLGSGFNGFTPPFFDIDAFKQKERPTRM
jgi:hypothetical protein